MHVNALQQIRNTFNGADAALSVALKFLDAPQPHYPERNAQNYRKHTDKQSVLSIDSNTLLRMQEYAWRCMAAHNTPHFSSPIPSYADTVTAAAGLISFWILLSVSSA